MASAQQTEPNEASHGTPPSNEQAAEATRPFLQRILSRAGKLTGCHREQTAEEEAARQVFRDRVKKVRDAQNSFFQPGRRGY